jgi:hypothetical protein
VLDSLADTLRMMAQIDRVIEAHGGWPGAFEPTVAVAAADALLAKATEDPPSQGSEHEGGD